MSAVMAELTSSRAETATAAREVGSTVRAPPGSGCSTSGSGQIASSHGRTIAVSRRDA